MTTNEVTSAGLITQQLSEIISDLQTDFQTIYGSDVNLDSNSPDGQMIGIFAQLKKDLLELITQVYNSFDPDAAEGAALDARVAINGIQRIGGTYTVAPVSITVDRAVTLVGLDGTGTPFTVADSSGNQFQLITTYAFVGAATATLNFQAANIGAVQVTVNDITSQVTVVIGVTAVNNPTAAILIGADEESDADLKLRRNISMSISSTNSADSLRAGLANVDAVTDSYVWENYTAVTGAYSVPSHTIWCIVEGGDAGEVAAAIYSKKGDGCGLFGSDITEVVTKSNGETMSIVFDLPVYVPLYITFKLDPRQSTASYDAATVKSAMVAGLEYHLFDTAAISDINTLLVTLVPGFFIVGLFISTDGINWSEKISPATPQEKFTVSAANISIT